ncbi:hypothetical protein [Fortiea contorta]|uniref:hypothetical protein n=1 Tax=Fortiea contorta TaxID=1892405 RepID=UPI0003482C4A|nr:hypothetical protein [Fortiea contorta]
MWEEGEDSKREHKFFILPISPSPHLPISPSPHTPHPPQSPIPHSEIFPVCQTIAGKIRYVAYNGNSGDACFRSLLTPHSARTTVRAVPFVCEQNLELLSKCTLLRSQATVFAMVEFSRKSE